MMFTIANTISVGTYTVGFSSSFLDLLTVITTMMMILILTIKRGSGQLKVKSIQDAVPGYNGIVDHGCRVDGCRDNDTRLTS